MTADPTPVRVLLVEDDPDDAALVREYLGGRAEFPCQVTHAADLSTGLARYAADGADVILLDLSLPDAHGLETVRTARAAAPAAPIVVLTGLNDEETGVAAVREGAQEYLTKSDLGPRPLVRAIRYARERKRAEEELLQTQERLRLAQKMEAVGRLAGGVAHDINNMMTVVTGFSEILIDRLAGGDPDTREMAEEVRKAGERAAAFTRQLLAFSRRQLLQPTVLDLNRLVADAGPGHRALLPAGVELAFIAAPDLRPVNADPNQVLQVLTNLVANARDAMPGGGTVVVETRNAELVADPAAAGGSGRPGAFAVLTVTDTGCGMDAATQARLFEPFFTTKGKGKATGMGLATVYGIVKQSGGHVTVSSEPGRGSTFAVYLPQVADATITPPGGSKVQPAARGSETVLLAEDEEGVRTFVRHLLERNGYTVLAAENGRAALRAAEAHGGPIHLLLTDTIMPEMGGWELAQRLVADRPAARVLYTSGYTDNGIGRRGVIATDVAFLAKPFTPAGLLGKVRAVLDGAGGSVCRTRDSHAGVKLSPVGTAG